MELEIMKTAFLEIENISTVKGHIEFDGRGSIGDRYFLSGYGK